MKKLGLQNIIVSIFVIGAIVALLVFSGVIKLRNNTQTTEGTVEVWGTIPFGTMQPYIDSITTNDLRVVYKVKNNATYESELINALAAGNGPDLFIMPHENILRHTDKIFEVPYTSFPQADYQDIYIDESKLFLTDTGVIAFPLYVDPLVMYYNKHLLASAFLLDVPEFWDQFLEFAPEITVANQNGEVDISAVALGTFDNLFHAKGLISVLLMQNGNPLVGTNSATGYKVSTLGLNNDLAEQAIQALEFFTSFAQFGNDNYSWNEALPVSRDMFIAGDLGVYFGKASEIETIRNKNPNLDFGVALLPQLRDSTRKITYGSMLGVAVNKQTTNVAGAISIASKLAGKDVIDSLANDLFVAPARKDLLRNKPNESYLTLFYNSAIIAAGWTDPDPSATEALFRMMIQDINTGKSTIQNAVSRANVDLNAILDRTINLTIPDRSLEN